MIEPMTIFGLISWIFSHVKPKRSSTPGPKFSMMMSHFFSRSTNTVLPSALFMLTVIERLLQLSIVKYRLSALGHVAQLAARRVALRRLELDHVRAHPREQLRAGRAGLHVGHVENSYAFECFHV